jgi:hypothetical protein
VRCGNGIIPPNATDLRMELLRCSSDTDPRSFLNLRFLRGSSWFPSWIFVVSFVDLRATGRT